MFGMCSQWLICTKGHMLSMQHVRGLKGAMLGVTEWLYICVCVCKRKRVSEREREGGRLSVSRGLHVLYCSPLIKQPAIQSPRQLEIHLKSLK